MASPKITLPTLGARAAPPSVEEARATLGGRVTLPADARLGALARFTDARGAGAEGVVVCETDREVDVWIGEGRFQRVAIERVRCDRVADTHPLADVAADARLFGSLAEGQPIRFLGRDGRDREGVLAERCRYGALVSHDGRLFAVSFRRLWPLVAEGA